MKFATCLAVLAAAVSSVTGENTYFFNAGTLGKQNDVWVALPHPPRACSLWILLSLASFCRSYNRSVPLQLQWL